MYDEWNDPSEEGAYRRRTFKSRGSALRAASCRNPRNLALPDLQGAEPADACRRVAWLPVRRLCRP